MIEEYLLELRQKYKDYKIIFNQKSNNQNIKLSILICSLLQRKDKLSKLLNQIIKQIKSFPQVQVLVNIDNRQKSTGTKRNILLNSANGVYIAAIDDDDRISDTYFKQIFQAFDGDFSVDCLSLQGRIRINGGEERTFIHDISIKKWDEKKDNRNKVVYYRGINHLNVCKLSIAKSVGFPDKTFGQDKSFSDMVMPFLKTQKKVKGVIYYYDYFDKK